MSLQLHTEQMPRSPEAAEQSMADQILTSAATLFSVRGYHAVGIRELADDVGLSTSTLYHYYSTKQDILFAVIHRFLVEFTQRLTAVLRDTSVPPRRRLEQAVTDHVVITVTRREELLVGGPVLNALSGEQRARITALRREYRDAVVAVIREGVATGDFRVEGSLLTATAMLDMLDGIRAWYRSEGLLALDDLAARYVGFALTLCHAER